MTRLSDVVKYTRSTILKPVSPLTRANLWFLVGVLLVVAWGSIPMLNADALWFDEWWSLFNAGGVSYEGVPLAQPLSLLEIWRQIKAVDPIHPPGYSFLLATWNALTGWSPFSGRTLSFLLGVLSVAMIYRAGRTLFGHSVGLWAAVILATSAFYRHYWHEMRMYTLLVGLHAVVLWAYWQVMVRRPHIWALLALVVGMAGLVYTQYLTVLALVPLGLFHLVWGKKGRAWWVVNGIGLVAVALYLPWVEVALGMFTAVNGGSTRDGVFTTAHILEQALAIASQGKGWAILAPLVLASLWSRGRAAAWIIGSWLVTLLLLLLINARTGMFIHIRYVLVDWVPLCLVLGLGAEQLKRWGIPAWLVVLVWAGAGLWGYSQFEASYNRDARWTLPWSGIVATLAPRVVADDVALVHVPAPLLHWTQERIAPYYTHSLGIPVLPTPLRLPLARTDWIGQIGPAERVWQLYATDTTPHGYSELQAVLGERYEYCGEVQGVAGIHIDLYAKTMGQCEPSFYTITP